jgi:SNF2 family DNA or RNA helicase
MYVHTPTKSLILRVQDPLHVRELLPDHSRAIALPDGHNLQVRWSLDSARLLRNIGVNAPSPIRSFYNWPGLYKPLDHQVDMADFMVLHPRAFNLGEMGTGKTYATLWAIDYLIAMGEIKRALIMCPLSSMKATWANDIFKILPHRTCTIVHGSADRRIKNLKLPCDIYILNHDGIDIESVAKEVRKREDIGLVVVDEASFFRNASTDRYRFLKWVMERKARLWMLTGTPCPNAPTDAWALSKLVAPERPLPAFGRFREELMQQITPHRWVPKEGARERAFEVLQPAIRVRKKDCISLPPLVGPRDVQTQLSKEQIEALKQMRNEMTMYAKEHQITAVNGADKLIKLRQILAGVVKDPNTGAYHRLDHKARLRDLRYLISQASAKVLVIVPFKGILQALAEELPKPDKTSGLPGYTVETLNGDVPPKRRNEIIERFKTTPDPHVLLCHPKVMAHGLNFTEADTTVFYAPIYSNDEYSQVIERFNRLGQTNTMYLIRMLAHPIEAAIYKVVDERGSMQSGILDLYQQFITGDDNL